MARARSKSRYELGMIKQNEIFVQVLDENGKPAESKTPLPPPSSEKAGQKPAAH